MLRLRPDHPEAGALLEETRLRASLEQRRPEPKRLKLRGPIRALVLTLLILACIVLLAIGARWAYRRWAEPLLTLQRVELRTARQWEQAYRAVAERDYAAAEQAFQVLLAEDPANTEAQKGLAQAQKEAALADDYAQAQQAIWRQDWSAAARMLAAIAAQDPAYRDLAALQASVQEQQGLSTWFDKAETAYRRGDWQEASTAYETLRDLNIDYQKATVTDHLFECYLKQGTSLVDNAKENRDAVWEAMSLFQKALTLKPQDARALEEMALADRYLEGQSKLAQGDLPGALVILDWVYRQRPDYAAGNAAALLKAAGGQVSILPPTPSMSAKQQQLSTWLEQAETAYRGGDWREAIAGFEALRALDLGYQQATVSEHLFDGYVKLGMYLVDSSKGEKESMLEARSLFQKALSLSPGSAEAVRETTLADKYLDGQDRLSKGDKAGALVVLAWVYEQKPNYAGGNIIVLFKAAGGQPSPPATSVPGTPASPMPTSTRVSALAPSPTRTRTPTLKPTATRIFTPAPTATATRTTTPIPTDTPAPTDTATPAPTHTPTAAPTPTPVAVVIRSIFQRQYVEAMQKGDAALSASDYTQAQQEFQQAAAVAVHNGYDSAHFLFAAYAKAGLASARSGNYAQAIEQVRTAMSIMKKSAVALPGESYEQYANSGDGYVERKDYLSALLEYGKALQVMGVKCDFGIENWSILP